MRFSRFCAWVRLYGLVGLFLSGSAFATTTYNVSIDTTAISGTKGKLTLDFITNNPGRLGNHVEILNLTAGGTLGLPETQGGLVTGDIILGLNPAPFTVMDSDFFFNEVTLNFISFGNSIAFQLHLPEQLPPTGAVPDQFALFILDGAGKPLFPTSDPLGANALFAVDVTGASGGALSVFTPTVFTPPNNLQITVGPIDTTPPVTTATASPGPNANGWNNTNVGVTLNAVDEPGGSGVKQIQFSLAGAQTGGSVVPGSAATVAISAEGITTLTYFAIDNAGNHESPKTLTVRIDKTPPVVTCSLSPNSLWPPNHKMVSVMASVTVTDALSGPAGFTLLSATSNEPDDNDIQGFVIGSRSTTGFLRAERLGSGSGRVYTLTYRGLDLARNSQECTATVTVPHDQGKK